MQRFLSTNINVHCYIKRYKLKEHNNPNPTLKPFPPIKNRGVAVA